MTCSVLLPTYNRPEWLYESVTSVLSQLYPLELLVLDNGSGVETEQVLRQFDGDPRMRRWRVETNGEVNAYMFLASKSTGDFIVQWADDDVMLPGCLMAKCLIMRDNPNLGLVWSQINGMDSEGSPLGLSRIGNISDKSIKSGALDFGYLLARNCIPMTSAVIRRECMGCDTRFSPYNDWALWLEIASKWDAGYLAMPTVSVRFHEGQETERQSGRLLKVMMDLWHYWTMERGVPISDDAWDVISIMAGKAVVDTFGNDVAKLIDVFGELKNMRIASTNQRDIICFGGYNGA